MKILPLVNGGVGAARRVAFIVSTFFLFGAAARAQTGLALVQHAPTLNASTVNGSIQQMSGENVTLNGNASVTGDLLVPGTPKVMLNGKPGFGGTIAGTGSVSPSNYTVALNGKPSLGHLRTRTNPIALPTVSAPPKPAGTRDVTLSSHGQSAGSFSTLRNLTLNGNIGQVAVPPGTYGIFTANGSSGFTLGVAGATQPAIYNLQGLTLNGGSQLQVVGPVILALGNGLTLNGTAGTSAHPEWLTLKIFTGGATLNGNVIVYGSVTAPTSAVTIVGSSQLIGGLMASQLTLNGNSLLRLQGTIIQPPVAANQSVTTNENTAVAITLAATQANNDPLTYTPGTPGHGTLSGTAPNLTYTPATNYFGADSFTFMAKDGTVSSNTATVSITVTKVNYPPVAASQSVTTNENMAVAIALAATQTNNDPLIYTVASPPAHGTLSGTAPNLTYTPATSYFGADSFTFMAKDGTVSSNPATVSITVTKVNYPPVAASQSVTTNENTAVAITLAATQTNNDPLIYAAGTPSHGTLSGTAPNLTYTPAANFFGTDSFTFTANDGAVGSNTATVSITVAKVNYPPVAASQSVTTNENTAVAITLAATQTNNDPLTFAVATQPAHGTLSGTAPNLNYTPAANYFGSDSFTFVANDGAVGSNTATVSITVTKVNYPPVAASQSVTTNENTAVAITLAATQTNNDPLTYTVASQPANGTLSGTAPNLTYTPAANFFGSDSFTFTANDGAVGSNTATVSIAVTKAPPVAASQSVTTQENAALAVTLTATQANNDPLTYTVGTPSHGTLSGTAPALTYKPAANYSGPDSFTFTANDGALISNAATVSITVTPYTALLEIMMPANGCTETYARPSLGAHYAGTTPVQPDSFHVYLDGHDFSSETTIESGEVMFMPLFNLGQGQHIYRIDWVYNGKVVATDNSTFTVNSVIVGGGTYFQGQVAATTGEPLVNVRVIAANQQTYTDVNGKFSFTNLPVGHTLFHFQTDAVTNAGKFTPVGLAFDVLSNQNTVWDRPIYLVAFDSSQGVMVQSNSAVAQVVVNPSIPGVQLVIPANTELAFPDGSSQGVVTIVNVPVDRAPNCLGPGFRPSRLISIQPENTILSQPAQLIMPNDLNLPNGAKLSLRNLDIASGQFVVTGTATVINNTLVTDPGSGVTTFDWSHVGPTNDTIDTTTTDTETPEDETDVVCSSMSPLEGSLEEDHVTPVYQSLGVSRSIQLHYNSRVAAPDAIGAATAFQLTNTTNPVVTSISATSSVGGNAAYYNNVPVRSTFVSATRTDLRGIPTGKTPLTLRVASYYPNGNDPSGYSVYSSQQVVQTPVINGAQLYPALGSGWSVGNIDRLVFPGDGSVLWVSGGKTAMSTFTPLGLASNVANSNLGFELGTLGGYSTNANPGNAASVNVVQSLGSILPSEGKYMAELAVPATAGASAELTLPFNLMPPGTAQISLSLDVLANTLVSDTTLFLSVSYNNTGPRSYSTDSSETVLPGADTGYARRTGFKTVIIDIPQSAWGQPGELTISLTSDGALNNGCAPPVTPIAIAALVDNIQVVGNPQIPTSSFIYSGENGDFSVFSFDPSTNQYQRLFKDGSKETFDQLGREISSSDRVGNTTTYGYIDATGSGQAFDLASMTDPAGLVTNLNYGGGKLSSITDPAGRSTSLAYDTKGNMTGITNPDGITRAFTYDGNGKMVSQSDGKGQARQYTYGSSGRIANVQRADGAIYNYTPANVAGFPANGASNSFADSAPPVGATNSGAAVYNMKDANGSPTSKQLNAYGQPTQVTNALGQKTAISYDDQRKPESLSLPNGNFVVFRHDGRGNLSLVNQSGGATTSYTYTPDFNLVQTATDPLGRTTNFAYDTNGNLMTITDPLGQMVAMTYNSHGQVLTRTDQRGKTTTYAYDSFGRVITVTDPLSRTTTTTYDNAGNVATVTDPLGHATSYLYNAGNKVIQMTAPDGGITHYAYDGNDDLVQVTDPLGHTTTTVYDVRRRPVSVTDAIGHVTKMTYDGVDNLLTVTDPAGNVTTYAYDELNRKVSATDPKGHITQWAYDTVGNVTKITRPDGSFTTSAYDQLNRLTQRTAADGSVTSYAYDNANELLSVTDPLNGVVQYAYDQLGRRISVTDQLNRDTQSAYDPASNLLKLTRPDSTATSYAYDAANQRISMTAADGGVTAYAYDNDGSLVSLTDPDGHTRQFGYDALNRPVTETDPLRHTRQKTYDVAGNLISLTRKDSAVINYTYDALNRLVGKTLPAIGSVPADTVTMGYDVLGNLASAANNAAAISNTYDADSLLTQTRETVAGNAQALSYAYDVLNRRTQMTDAGGGTSYTYDNRDRLTKLVDPQNRSFNFAYDALSRITSKIYPNGVNASYIYDAASELLSLVNGSAASATYTYDAVGRRTAETREDGNSRNFNYDPVDRVLSSVSSAPSVVNSESFSYDQVGNWTVNSRQHDGDNKLTSDASYNYTYDVEGNLIQKASKTNPADVTTYAYDAENKLVHVTVGSAVTATIAYQYDALGRRVARTVNGVTTRYVIDGNNIRLELNSGNQIIAANTESGLDQLLVRDTSTGSYFVHQDGLGSTTAITDNTGAVVERYRYSSFGQLSVLAPDYSLKPSNLPLIPNTYTGREWDSDAGIYFYRARFYSPVMGRFLSQDPLGNAAGINYYAYCSNNPLLLTDPMGLIFGTGLSWGEFFGAAGSGALQGAKAYGEGLVVGAAITGAVVLAAPVVAAAGATALATVGVEAATATAIASATVTGTLTVAGGVGVGLTAVDIGKNVANGNGEAVAYDLGGLVGGVVVTGSGGGRFIADNVSPTPSTVPESLNPFTADAGYGATRNSDLPLTQDIFNLLSTGPTPSSGGAAAIAIASGLNVEFRPNCF